MWELVCSRCKSKLGKIEVNGYNASECWQEFYPYFEDEEEIICCENKIELKQTEGGALEVVSKNAEIIEVKEY